jgi:hypothetical protein
LPTASAFDQRTAGKILAALFERQFGTIGPARLEMLDDRDLPALLLLLGDRAGGRSAHLDERLLHFHDDHPDRPRRIVGAIDEIGHVGGDDVAGAGEDAHGRLLMMVAAAVQAWALCSTAAPGWTETGAMAAPMKKVDSASAATAEAMRR